MDYFNKEEFQQLKNLPRSANQKSETMDRIRTSSSNPPRNYPMKYVVTSIAAVVLAIILIGPELFSSNQQANEPNELTEPTDPTPNIPIEPEEPTDATPNTPTAPDENTEDDVTTSILNTLEIGMSEAEVQQVLGEYYVTGEATTIYVDGKEIWRYEIEKKDEYKYEVGGDVRKYFLELESMHKGNINMLLFITWDKQRFVKQYNVIYNDMTDSKIYDIRVLQDGTIQKQPIYPIKDVNTENMMIDLDILKTQIKIGMNMKDVEKLLGSHYKTIVDVERGTLIWEYNFGKDPESYNNGLIEIDTFEEMIKGTFQAQFSITWDENNLVSNFYGIYKNANDNKIYEYGLFPDGQSKDNPIYP